MLAGFVLAGLGAGAVLPLPARAADPAAGPAASFPDTAAAEGAPLPEAWWQLGGGTGDDAADSSGHGHLLKLLRNPAYFSDGSVSPARVSLLLNRDLSQWGTTDGPLVDTTRQFTWSAWVRPDLTAGTAADGINLPVMAQEGARNSFDLKRNQQGFWQFDMPQNDTVLYTDTAADAPGGGQVLDVAGTVRAALGAWTHLAVVYDKSGANKAYLYVNGQLAGSQNNPPAWKTTGPLLVGGNKQKGSYWGAYPGLIRDVRVYTSALSAAQVTQLYNFGLREQPGLAAQWLLDDGSGTTAADTSGNANTLTLHNGASWDADMSVSPPLVSLNLVSGQSQYAATAAMTVNTRGSYSVAAWVRLRPGGPSGQQVVLSQQKGTQSAFVFSGGVNDDWRVWLRRENDALLSLTSGVRPVAGRWYHLVYVQDKGPGNRAYLFVDGQQKQTLADPPYPQPSEAFQVGRQMNGGAYGAYLDGNIRDVRAYAYPLSAAQVTALYQQGRDRAYAPVPEQLTVSPCGPGCAPLGFDSVTSAAEPDLSALMRGPADGKWDVGFQVRDAAGSKPGASGTVTGIAAGQTATWHPDSYLPEGSWEFQARASDGHTWGAWSPWLPFTVKAAPPGAPVVTSAEYREGKWGGPVTGELSWHASPWVTDYSWRLDNGAWTDYKPDTTAKVENLVAGWHVLQVKARNWAGLEGPVTSFGFGVGPAPLLYPDLDGDGAADVIAATGAGMAPPGDADLLPGEEGGSVLVVPGGTALPGKAPAVIRLDMAGITPDGAAYGNQFGTELAYGDFDGDGHTDLAIGVPGATVDGQAQAGEVVVLDGTPDWPYVKAGAVLTAANTGLGKAEAGDKFGQSLAAARYSGQFAEGLAIGVPGREVDGHAAAGEVTVLHGGAKGLTGDGAQVLSAQPWDKDEGQGPATGARFGWSLAAGDLTGTEIPDLVILAQGPGNQASAAPAGTVYIAAGRHLGDLAPVTDANGVLTAADARVEGHFRQVVTGTFHGGANADVVIAADGRYGTGAYSGTLAAVRGDSEGIDPGSVRLMTQATPGGNDRIDGFFGGSMAAGFLDPGGPEDLAVGELGEGRFTGTVTVFAGGPGGIFSRPPLTISPSDPLIAAPARGYDGFGYGLAIQPAASGGVDRLLVTSPQQSGSIRGGTLYALDLTVTPVGPKLTGATAYPGSALMAGEPADDRGEFGPGAPMAGGITAFMGQDQVPLRARLSQAPQVTSRAGGSQ